MKKKELETNPLNELFHAFDMERKPRDTKEELEIEAIEDDSELSDIQDKKRARYEVLKKKARIGWDD